MNSRNENVRTQRIDVVDVIDSQPLSGFQFRIIALCALVAMFDGFDAQSIAFVAPIIAAELGMRIDAFGPIFAANLVGMALGALTLGPLADRFGRKAIVVGSTFVFGLFSLVTAWADSPSTLMLYRFLTGLGLGAAMPNIIALTSEYAPKRSRAWLVTIMFVGFPFGAVIGGLISSAMIPVLGWKSVFVLGGIGPMVLSVVLLLWLAESLRFMVHHEASAARIGAILEKIAPALNVEKDASFELSEKKLSGASVKNLFTEGRSLGTVILWVPFFMNLLLLFFMYNWLPPVLQQAGLPITKAIFATVLFNLGGVAGGLILARLIDRIGPFGVLGTAYALGALSVATIGLVSSSIPLIMAAVFVSGFWVVGAQFGANALAASYYPTSIRSTGVGWALGIGRIGSIIGPLVGGLLMSLKWPFSDLFLAAAVPAAIAAVAILALRYVAPKETGAEAVRCQTRPSAV